MAWVPFAMVCYQSSVAIMMIQILYTMITHGTDIWQTIAGCMVWLAFEIFFLVMGWRFLKIPQFSLYFFGGEGGVFERVCLVVVW
jgi:hypothetical protein